MLNAKTENNFGIILKRFYPIKKKLIVLTQNNGKIQITTKPSSKCQSLWPGMLISLTLPEKQKNISCAQNIDILFNINNTQPFKLVWFHHILEICYYFVPLNSPCKEIFDFVSNCVKFLNYENNFNKNALIIKNIFLLKLLVLIGFYPPQQLIPYLKIYNKIYIDFVSSKKVYSEVQHIDNIEQKDVINIQNWIKKSLQTHPLFKNFNTLHFRDEF